MEFDLENPLLPTSDDFFNADTMTSLFSTESDHMPSYANSQSHHFSIRGQTIPLILHFSRNFDPFLSYLAINYLDRFLSTKPISGEKPWMLKLVAVSCVSLAMKMKKTEFSVTDIEHDGGLIFDSRTIQRMELLILGALEWRMRSITAFAFINFFISFFKFKDPPSTQALKARATEIILRAQNEIKLFEFKPSIISASALLSASHELFPLQFSCFRNAILNCSFVNKENFLSCYNVVEDIAREGYESIMDMVSSSSTPANVLDLQYCWSSSSSDDEQTTDEASEAATATLSLKKDLKRRKIGGFRSQNTYHQLSQSQQC